MDNEKDIEEKPSTSKKDDKRREDLDEKERDDLSYTDSSVSVASSKRSGLVMKADTRPETSKKPLMTKKDKPGRRKRVRRGRISKRRRSAPRRHTLARRAQKRPGTERKDRNPSVSTIFSRLSSRSGTDSACHYCGHRCCGRRLIIYEAKQREKEAKRRKRRMLVTKITEELKRMRQKTCRNKGSGKRKRMKQRGVQKKVQKKRGIATDKKKDKHHEYDASVTNRNLTVKELNSGSEAKFVSSTSKMLSTLFVRTDATLEEGPPAPMQLDYNYKEITPEMIFYTLQRLQKWREYLNLDFILPDLKKCYPVNPNTAELTTELVEKLRVAVISGILVQKRIKNVKHWCLAYNINKRGLTRDHVSIFWEDFSDSVSPVRRKKIINSNTDTTADEMSENF